MINQLMVQLNNMIKLEKYQQEKVMITLQVVCQILLILKKNYRLIAVDLSKQKVLDADSRAIQRIIFTGKIKAAVANTKVIIIMFLKNQKKQYQNVQKEQQKSCK